jgi:hypothetical protein
MKEYFGKVVTTLLLDSKFEFMDSGLKGKKDPLFIEA